MVAARNTEGVTRNGNLFFLFDPGVKVRETGRALSGTVARAARPNGARSVARPDGRDFSRKHSAISKKSPLRGASSRAHPRNSSGEGAKKKASLSSTFWFPSAAHGRD